MKPNLKYGLYLLGALSSVLFFQNCGQPGAITSSSTETALAGLSDPNATYSIRKLSSTKFICEPFGAAVTGPTTGGLKAELAYIDPQSTLTATQKTQMLTLNYFSGVSPFVKLITPLYLSQINVPTRSFERGFQLSDGSYVADTNGNRLIEYFGLKMTSTLKLSDADPEGYYDFITISDDGSRVYFGEGAQQQEIINNDGGHSTKMKCAQQSINMTRSSKIPMTYYYNQGPRTKIANVMAWKYVGAQPSTTKNALCDKDDNDGPVTFWNSADQTPSTYWTQVASDGFKILDPKNFELPGSEINPCTTQNTNQITSADFVGIPNSVVTLDLTFGQMANIKAQLFKVVNGQNILVKSYDFSGNSTDKISVNLPVLDINGVYSLDISLQSSSLGTQFLNEVRFQLLKN